MKLRLLLGVTVFVGGAVLATQTAVAKDKKSGVAQKKQHDPHEGHNHEGHDHEGHDHDGQAQAEGDMDPAMMAAWMKASTPGQHHAYLSPMAGDWNYTIRWRMAPEAPWTESTGAATNKMIMGGRFMVQDVRGETMGMPFHGMATIGYDNIKQEYVNTWMDNMGTMIILSYGSCDDSGKVFTFRGKMDDPMSGKKDVPYKTVTTVLNDDKHTFEWSNPHTDGKMFKMMEIIYTRK